MDIRILKNFRLWLLLVLPFLIVIAIQIKPIEAKGRFEVDKCPKVDTVKNVNKQKLLGYWYGYATTPLPFQKIKDHCFSYNVKNSPHFKNIFYTDYYNSTITYYCLPNAVTKKFDITIRVLTRTKTPHLDILGNIRKRLAVINVVPSSLTWLGSNAYCFEWYVLKFDSIVRPKHFQAPFNGPYDYIGR